MRHPATPLRVEWDRLASPRLYEDMVSTLLSIQHPDAVRTDGSGGDLGRDVHFAGPDGLEIFELKSFTGRVNQSRRRQVKSSFERAMALSPAAWSLVVPIDPTDAEQTWFAKLTEGSSANCRWIGRTQLDAGMAAHPSVPRYFLTDVAGEVRELVELFQAEQAALVNGVLDAIDRVRGIAGLLDAIDPFYRVDIRFDSATGESSCSLSPRYPGADRDRPITVRANLVFPDQVAARQVRDALQATYDFGIAASVPADYIGSVLVDAPAGLGGEFGPGDLRIGPRELRDTPEMKLTLIVTSPEGVRLTALPLAGRAETAGARGVIATLSDASRSLRLQLKLDWVTSTFTMNYTVETQPGLPSVLRPTMRFLSAFRTPNLVTFVMEGGIDVSPPTEIDVTTPLVDDGWLHCVELLARVQDRTNTWFDMPDELSAEDVEDLEIADRLLAGKIVKGTWQGFGVTCTKADALNHLNLLVETAGTIDGAASMWQVSESTLLLGGYELPLGLLTTHMHSSRLRDPEETKAAVMIAGESEEIALNYVPATVATFDRWCGHASERPQTP